MYTYKKQSQSPPTLRYGVGPGISAPAHAPAREVVLRRPGKVLLGLFAARLRRPEVVLELLDSSPCDGVLERPLAANPVSYTHLTLPTILLV